MHDKRLPIINKSGEYNVILDYYDGEPFTGPNDLWFDDVGGLHFTDSYAGHEDRGNNTRVFYYAPTGEFILLADDYYKSNGLHGSTDGRWLYIADYLDDKVYRDSMLFPGKLGERSLFVEYRCDGMMVDEYGNIYISTVADGAGILVYIPQGHLISQIHVPEWTSNVTFAGPEGNILVIATAKSVYTIAMQVRDCKAAMQ
jgi:gluconolactonase